MDSLLSLIDSRINKAEKNSNALRSVPCKVIELLNNDYVKVQIVTDSTIYTVLNRSGTNVNVGETVSLYYQGMINNKSAYIGAAITKEEGGGSGCSFNSIIGDVTIGEVFPSVSRIIGACPFKALINTNAFVVYNCVIQGVDTGTLYLHFYIDGEEIGFSPTVSVTLNQYITQSFVLPFTTLQGNHMLQVRAIGYGYITSATLNVCGTGIEVSDSPYEPTAENDYIYETVGSSTNTIYYIGETSYPSIPTTINGEPTTIIRATTFTNSSINTVYIPEGVEEIE